MTTKKQKKAVNSTSKKETELIPLVVFLGDPTDPETEMYQVESIDMDFVRKWHQYADKRLSDEIPDPDADGFEQLKKLVVNMIDDKRFKFRDFQYVDVGTFLLAWSELNIKAWAESIVPEQKKIMEAIQNNISTKGKKKRRRRRKGLMGLF